MIDASHHAEIPVRNIESCAPHLSLQTPSNAMLWKFSAHLACRREDSNGQHEREDDLVALEEAALDVDVDLVGEVLDDVVDALAGDGCPLGRVYRQLIQLVELQPEKLPFSPKIY